MPSRQVDNPKELELRSQEITNCAGCDGPLVGGEDRSIQFYRVKCDTFIPNYGNLQQRAGLEMYFGSGGGDSGQVRGIADVFAPSKVADGFAGDSMLFCFGCLMRNNLLTLIEAANERKGES